VVDGAVEPLAHVGRCSAVPVSPTRDRAWR
jgi:hypothetical protein